MSPGQQVVELGLGQERILDPFFFHEIERRLGRAQGIFRLVHSLLSAKERAEVGVCLVIARAKFDSLAVGPFCLCEEPLGLFCLGKDRSSFQS